MYAPGLVSSLFAYTNLITISNSQVSKAVDAWKANLISKKCPKIAVHPDVNPELFEEG
jgi:coatomer subunit beta'